MNSWCKQKAIEKILMQLDEQELPFKQAVFVKSENGLVQLGKGGFGFVYEAEERSRKKKKKHYAVKVIGIDEERVVPESFRREVEIQKEVGDFQDTIVKIYDSVELLVWVDEEHQLVKVRRMDPEKEEKAEGDPLLLEFILLEKLTPVVKNDTIMGGVIPRLADFREEEILKFAGDIGIAIRCVHKKGILHRDIKPLNIYYSSEKGCYKLGDFGISKVMENGFSRALSHSPSYTAPEVIFGKEHDVTADIYSFGMTLYVLLNRMEELKEEDRCSPGYEAEEPLYGSDELMRVVLKMIAYQPEDRYQSIDEVLDELDGLRYGRGLKYQREHKQGTLVFGATFALMGACLWNLSFQTKLMNSFSIGIGIFCILCIFRGIIVVFGGRPELTMFLNFGVGIVVLLQRGFSWKGLLLVFLLTCVLDVSAGVAGACVLCQQLTERMAQAMQLTPDSFSGYRWIAVLLLSLAALLLLLRYVLSERGELLIKVYLKNGTLWIYAIVGYISLILFQYGVSNERWMSYKIYKALLGTERLAQIISCKPGWIGICGLGFCLFWVLREKVLVWLEQAMDRKWGIR